MLSFNRKYSVNIQRNAFIFGITFMPFVIAWTSILIYGFPELSNQLIYLPFLGKSFEVAFAWIFLGLFGYFFTAWILAKRGYIAYPSTTIARDEIKAYNQKYDANFSLPRGKGSYYLRIFLSLLILPIFVSLPHLFLSELGPNANRLLAGLGFILTCIVFYGGIRKIMQKDSEAMVEVFKHANQHLPHTKIQLQKRGLEYTTTPATVSTGLTIEGLFKKHDFSVQHTAYGAYRHVTSKGGIQLSTPLQLNFSISERTPLQNKITGSTLEECFKKRFKVKGIKTEELSDVFKQKLLESFKSIDLKVENGWISQSFKHTYYLPFYSAQGLILFLDFLVELENLLNSHPSHEV